MAQYDELTQGLLKTTVKVTKPAENFTWGQNVLFGNATIGTDQDYINLEDEIGQVVIPEEAVKGLDPTRVNYGVSFDQKRIASQYYFPEDTVDLKAAQNRLFGEPVDQPWSVAKRQLVLTARKRDAMAQGFTTRKEMLAFECALNGKFVTRDDGEQVFPMTASLLNMAGANLITKPFETINAAASILFQSGVIVKRLVLNPTDAANLAASTAWHNLLDKKKVIVGELNPQEVDGNGMAKLGTMIGLISGEVEILTYAGFYRTSSGNVNFIPQGKALLLPANAIGCMGYTGLLAPSVGPNGEEVQNVVPAKELFTVYGEKKGALVTTKIQGQTAPAPILDSIDGYGVLTGIPAA